MGPSPLSRGLFRFAFDHFLHDFASRHIRDQRLRPDAYQPPDTPKELPLASNPRKLQPFDESRSSVEGAPSLPPAICSPSLLSATQEPDKSTGTPWPRYRRRSAVAFARLAAFPCLNCLEWRPTLLCGKRGKVGTGLSLPGTEEDLCRQVSPFADARWHTLRSERYPLFAL